MARSYILSPAYDAKELADHFISDLSDNILYGWADEGKKAVVMGGENVYVPAYRMFKYLKSHDSEMIH